jgi:hypothetical protein
MAVIGNIIKAAAGLGGIHAAINLLVPLPVPTIVLGSAAVIFALGSYFLIRSIFAQHESECELGSSLSSSHLTADTGECTTSFLSLNPTPSAI